MSERIDAYLLEDILESIQNIFQFTEGVDFEQFDSDIKTRHAVQHNFICSFLVRRLKPAGFICHMESPNDHRCWVYVRSWGFHDYRGSI